MDKGGTIISLTLLYYNMEYGAFADFAFGPDAASAKSVVVVQFDDVAAEHKSESGAISDIWG